MGLSSLLCDDLEGWDVGPGVGGRHRREVIHIHV